MSAAGPAAGSVPSAPREEILEPLRRVTSWLLALRDERQRVLCPEHGIEHTGKSAYLAVLCCELARWERDARVRDALIEAALGQGQRLVARLEREGTSPCHTFRPGRHDPFNCSNSVIDGGACSDALAELARELAGEIPEAERQAFAKASLLHARTYLRYAVLDKGIPAQRAWGLTGIAGAYRLEQDAELERAGLEAVGLLEGVQHPDGSYPYHPLEWGAAHPGASDVSAFYQSRVSAFLIHALEGLGRDPRQALFAPPILRGLEFLCALQGPHGRKIGLVEAKPWYWGADYEVASHPFDVYALARGCELYRRPRYGQAALRAFKAWAELLEPDGAPASHAPGRGRGRSYQCPVFWAAHAAWLARAAPALERIWAQQPLAAAEAAPAPTSLASIDISIAWFPSAALARLEDARIVAWVRGARPGANVAHGSPHGAGLLQVVRKHEGRELLLRERGSAEQEGEWSARSGWPAPRRGWSAGADELRFSLWRARVHLRARRPGAALLAPLETFARGVCAYASPRVSSAFELQPELELLPDGVLVRSHLAWRDGQRVPWSGIERSYRLDGQGLLVSERLVTRGGARGLRYRVPAAAQDVQQDGAEWRYSLR